MAKRLKTGDKLPAFSYDTPYEPQKSFYALLQGECPVLMVFLPNFGHPISRHFISQYLETIYALRAVRLVCVVRSRPETIAAAVPRGALPFELICDAEGALYDYFQIPQKQGLLRCYSLEGMRILKQARQQGYCPSKNEYHQLPLTLVVDREGRVQFVHYGRSMTDLPADCSAMEHVARELRLPTESEPVDLAVGFEQPEETIRDEDELLAVPEENRDLPPQQTVPEQDEPQSETEWTAAPESSEYPPQSSAQEPDQPPQPPQKPTELPVEPEEPLPASVWRGKMIYSPDHVPVKVDFSALGFEEEER